MMRDEIRVEVLNTTNIIPLSWTNGMIGALPVFKTREDALSYVNGDATKILPIKETK